MTSLSENTVVTTSGGLVELGRVTKNTTSIAVTSSGVSVCGPLTVVCDGSPIVVEYYCPQTDAPGNAGSYIYFRLDEDGIEKTRYWAVNKNSAASPAGIPIYAKRVLTPSAGVHTYEVKAFVDSGTGYAYANTENSTTGAAPAFLRVSKIVQASQFIVPLASAPLVTSLPSAPIDGQEIRYVADATNGIIWNLRYRAASSSSYKWEFIGGSQLASTVGSGTGGTPWTSTSYPSPITSGNPGVITLPLPGDYNIEFRGFIQSSAAGAYNMYIGFVNASSTALEELIFITVGTFNGSNLSGQFRLNGVTSNQTFYTTYRSGAAGSGMYVGALKSFVTPIRVG